MDFAGSLPFHEQDLFYLGAWPCVFDHCSFQTTASPHAKAPSHAISYMIQEALDT